MSERPRGDCPKCRRRYWTTADGRMWRHEIWKRSARRYVWCEGGGQLARPLARMTYSHPKSPRDSHG